MLDTPTRVDAFCYCFHIIIRQKNLGIILIELQLCGRCTIPTRNSYYENTILGNFLVISLSSREVVTVCIDCYTIIALITLCNKSVI